VAEQPPHVMIIDLPRQSQRRTWPRSVRAQWGSSVEPLKLFVGMVRPSLTIKNGWGVTSPTNTRSSGWIERQSRLLDAAKLASVTATSNTWFTELGGAVTTPSMGSILIYSHFVQTVRPDAYPFSARDLTPVSTNWKKGSDATPLTTLKLW
jgi:hypothetical protein